MKLVECVPNFSEGRDLALLDDISRSVESVAGVSLLDVHSGDSVNRSVFTFAGEPDAVEQASLAAVRTAVSRIDMRLHQGVHPRLGAVDVCPFVPLKETGLEECVEMARRVGKQIGEELGLPVYLYEAASTRRSRRRLADIRRGEYEALPEKVNQPGWQPDFGPAIFNPRSGATVVGARPILVAYNVNLDTQDLALARDVAREVRRSGKVAALGWTLPELGRAQVSLNLTDLSGTSLHEVFKACRHQARQRGSDVTGSEIVGMTPLEPLLAAGRYARSEQGETVAVDDDQLVASAVDWLGLSEIRPFHRQRKILEYCLPLQC